MTYELLYYIFICLVGLTFCFIRVKSNFAYTCFTFLLFIIYSFITRYSGFDIDMKAYVNELSGDDLSTYYIKEPVYWLLSRYIYQFTQSAEITFITFDAISFLLVIKARENMKFPLYFPYLFLLFFPSAMVI